VPGFQQLYFVASKIRVTTRFELGQCFLNVTVSLRPTDTLPVFNCSAFSGPLDETLSLCGALHCATQFARGRHDTKAGRSVYDLPIDIA